jgi:hypothetical protein
MVMRLRGSHIFYTVSSQMAARLSATRADRPLTPKMIPGIGPPIILGRRPSLSAHGSESTLRTSLVCRKKQGGGGERERERESKLHVGEAHCVLITAILLTQLLSCYWHKIASLRMLPNLRLADLRLATAQQRTTGQNLRAELYWFMLVAESTSGPTCGWKHWVML